MRLTALLLFIFCSVATPAETPDEQIARAQNHHRRGEMTQAQEILLHLVKNIDGAPPWLARAYTDLGVICHEQGRTKEAEGWHLKARPLVEPKSILHFQVLNNLASVYFETGQSGKGERIVEELKGLEPPPGELTARSHSSLGALHMVRGRNKEAEQMFLQALAWWEKSGNPREAAVALNNLGVLAMSRDDKRTAVSRLRRSYELWSEHMGGEHPMFLPTIANYGAALLANGKAVDAEVKLNLALTYAKQLHGEEAPVTVQVAAMYAEALSATGRKKEAKSLRAKVSAASSALRPHTVDVLDLQAK